MRGVGGDGCLQPRPAHAAAPITALLAMGWHLAEVPTVPVAPCVVAPLALHVPALLPGAAWSVRTAVILVATAVPLGVAAALVSMAAAADPYGY